MKHQSISHSLQQQPNINRNRFYAVALTLLLFWSLLQPHFAATTLCVYRTSMDNWTGERTTYSIYHSPICAFSSDYRYSFFSWRMPYSFPLILFRFFPRINRLFRVQIKFVLAKTIAYHHSTSSKMAASSMAFALVILTDNST